VTAQLHAQLGKTTIIKVGPSPLLNLLTSLTISDLFRELTVKLKLQNSKVASLYQDTHDIDTRVTLGNGMAENCV